MTGTYLEGLCQKIRRERIGFRSLPKEEKKGTLRFFVVDRIDRCLGVIVETRRGVNRDRGLVLCQRVLTVSFGIC